MTNLLELVFNDDTKRIITYDKRIDSKLNCDFINNVIDCEPEIINIGNVSVCYYKNVLIPFSSQDFMSFINNNRNDNLFNIYNFFGDSKSAAEIAYHLVVLLQIQQKIKVLNDNPAMYEILEASSFAKGVICDTFRYDNKFYSINDEITIVDKKFGNRQMSTLINLIDMQEKNSKLLYYVLDPQHFDTNKKMLPILEFNNDTITQKELVLGNVGSYCLDLPNLYISVRMVKDKIALRFFSKTSPIITHSFQKPNDKTDELDVPNAKTCYNIAKNIIRQKTIQVNDYVEKNSSKAYTRTKQFIHIIGVA